MSDGVRPKFSVVVPVYNEAGNIAPLIAEIAEVMTALGELFEVLVVNDGSGDATLDELRSAMARHEALQIVDLDGNFGEAAALCAGFRHARGDLVVTLDGDGQNPPHDIPRVVDTLCRGNYRVVSGWRVDRKEDRLRRVWPSRLANSMIALVTGIPLHDNGCGLKVYRRDVLAGAALPRGMNRFMPAIFGVRPHEVAEVRVADRRRQHGQSHYGISRTLAVLRDLLALRWIIRAPRQTEPAAAVLTAAAIAATAASLRSGSLIVTLAGGVSGVIAGLVWWNLRRFNRAQRDGVFRVRHHYLPGTLGEAA